MWKKITLRIVGAAPLLMNNGMLCDPLYPARRAIDSVSGRRQKTLADHEELGRVQFLGALNIADGEPCITGEQLEACLKEGARRSKKGKKVEAGVLCDGNFPLLYEGPRSPADLWEDQRFRLRVPVKIGKARVPRTRPMFREWACEFIVEFSDGIVDADHIRDWAAVAGVEIGLGDWRPRFGRFTVEVI